MVALRASRLVCPATSWISLTTSPIFCADCASEPICSLVDPASFTAVLTMLLVCSSCRLISAIVADSSSAAPAAISTFIDASFDVSTAPSARCEVLLDAANSVDAVVRIARACSLTVFSMVSTRGRNTAIAASMAARRSSCAVILSRSWSVRRSIGDVLMC